MSCPAAHIRMQRGPDALGEREGLARHLPPDLRENIPHDDQAGTFETGYLPNGVFPWRRHLGRSALIASKRLRPLYFLARKEVDHLSHCGSVSSVFVADDHTLTEPFSWMQKNVAKAQKIFALGQKR